MRKYKKADNLQIIKKGVEGSDKKCLLKLNRLDQCLEVFEKVSNDRLKLYHSIREDFDSSDYAMFEKIQSMNCICGGKYSLTPYGIFNIERKSKDCYVSTYHKKYDQVKFFGYLVFFEDYFIHSNMYLVDVDEHVMRKGNAKCISVDDEFTAGCIRVCQDDIDWLISNIDVDSIIIL